MKLTPPGIVLLSDWVYRRLLVLYPVAFRRAYAAEMAQVFRDVCRDVWRQRGGWGVVALWIATLGDLATTTVVERLAERRQPAIRSVQSTRWCGLAGIGGGALWLLLSTSLAFKWPVRAYLGSLLAAVGLCFLCVVVGLFARYRRRTGAIGKAGLLLAMIGVVPVAAVGVLKLIHVGDTGWPAFLLLTNLLFIGLVLFGGDAMRMNARSPLGVVPIVMGLAGLVLWMVESQSSGPWQLVGLLYL
jgi:hypothetical protein